MVDRPQSDGFERAPLNEILAAIDRVRIMALAGIHRRPSLRVIRGGLADDPEGRPDG